MREVATLQVWLPCCTSWTDQYSHSNTRLDFLDCSKCYERVPLPMLEEFALESGYPLYAPHVALKVHSGNRHHSHMCSPDWLWALAAVDMLLAFPIKSFRWAGR
eukprot:2479197-Amphidinium_carterae.1